MTTFSVILFLTIGQLLRIDILIWVLGIPAVLTTAATLYYQKKQHRQLRTELRMLSKVKRNTIEYDLVLKAMKLTVWRIDVPTRTITYESDFRETPGIPIIAPNSDVELFCNTLTPESKERITAGMNQLLEGHIEEFHEQYEMILQQGKVSRWGEMYATVDQRDINGRPVTIVGTSMNIDRQKDIERALIEARNKAEESDRLKSAFLANISHEIRTPLNAIVGFSDVLSMVQSEEERTQLVNLIKQNNAQLLRLFDDMVNMSKLDAGGDAVKKEHFDLKTLLVELADRYQPEYDKKGIVLQTSVQDTDLQLYTDRGRLREILNQYLNNALKFTEKGSVTIGYELRGEHVRLWVRDTGKGIPAEHCNEHLFERFFKVDEFIAGTGLGLSICRSLAQTLGGTVGVESKEGAGSLFWVEIALE
jgi:signal transduction histidine kinase